MLSATQKTVLLIAGTVLLFVVLCPATPTPTAVVKKQVTITLLLVAAALQLWKPAQPVFLTAGSLDVQPRESGPSILELICTRLC